MVRKLLLISAGVASLILAALPAQAVDLQPGLWELTGKSERDGVVKAHPAKTRCITPEVARKFGPSAFQELNAKNTICSTSDWQTTANGAQWRVRCVISNVPIETAASYEADSPQHYKAEFKSSLTIAQTTARSTRTLEGRRIGECPK